MERGKKIESGFVIEERYSVWQKKKVRTILVNAHSKNASQRFITTALSIAEPNDRIELSGGDYCESISLTLPIELVASDGEEPRLTSRGSPITVASDVKVYLENLTVVCKGGSKAEAGLMLMGGNICCHSCSFSSVLIGGTAHVSIFDSVISESNSGYGLIVQDSGSGCIARTVLHSHSLIVAEIDTYEEFKLEECTLFNKAAYRGNILMLTSGLSSTFISESVRPTSSCRRVKVTNCVIYVSREIDREAKPPENASKSSLDEDSSNPYGIQCCVIIANGACPTLCDNELTEGEVGIYLDFTGAAQIARNVIRLQRRCGVLAIVEHGYAPSQADQQLCIIENNVLDNCSIGIDVIHSSCGRRLSGINFDKEHLFSSELPSQRRQSNWLSATDLIKAPPDSAFSSDALKNVEGIVYGPEDAKQRVFFHGAYDSLQNLRNHVIGLIYTVLRAYPVCLRDAFKVVSGALPFYGSEDASGPGAAKNVNEYVQLIMSTLGIALTSNPDEKERQKVLQRLGNKGVRVTMTKFVNCSLCAIRFGRHSYGIVESCQFEDCKSHAVVIDSGAYPLITGCHFLSSSKAVLVLYKFSEPLIIGNEIAMGSSNGIEASNLSGGVIAANIIQNQLGSGIYVTQNSYSLIVANLISKSSQSGIDITNQSTPLVLNNKLFYNSVAHINCSESSNPFIAFNRLHFSPGAGMHFTDCSIGIAYKNTIRHNGDGIVLELDADPQVEWNYIKMNTRFGLLARNNALGNFVRNEIGENTQANVIVSDGAFPVLRDNTIQKGLHGGVVVHSEGLGLFEKNHLSENSAANVFVVGLHSKPCFVANMINAAPSGCGVMCAQGAGGMFERNHIYENTQCGVYVVDTANPTFRENHIRSEPIGVFISDRGKGVYLNNSIYSCQSFGILTAQEGDPTFEENTVYHNQMAGILIAPDGIGKYFRNTFRDNGFGIQLGSSIQPTTVNVKCVFLKTKTVSSQSISVGIPFRHIPGNGSTLCNLKKNTSAYDTSTDSAPHNATDPPDQRCTFRLKPVGYQIKDNKVFHNQLAGVLLSANCNGLVEQNEIYKNNDYGVCADPCYAASCMQPLLQGKSPMPLKHLSTHHNFAASGSQFIATALFNKNTIYGNRVANVFYNSWYAKDQTHWTGNDIYEAPIGFYIGNRAYCNLVEGNKIHDCLDGVYAEFGAVGNFSGNYIYDCAFSGLYVSHGASPSFTRRNIIERCGLSGVLIDLGGRANVEQTTIQHCSVGVIVCCVDGVSSSISHEAAIAATHALTPCTFSNNTIEENETHGVLLLSASKLIPLRVGRHKDEHQSLRNTSSFAPPLDSDVIMRSLFSSNDRSFALFDRNTIQRNRMCGIFVDRFDLSNFISAFQANGIPLLDDTIASEVAKAMNIRLEDSVSTGFNEMDLDAPPTHFEKEQLEKYELQHITFRENIVRDCSIGFVSGYGCLPFLLGNKIENNVFFGLLLRPNSGVAGHENMICQNGVAGVYAAKGSRGVVGCGNISENNGFCRYLGNKNQTRNFSDYIFSKNFLEHPWKSYNASSARCLKGAVEPTLLESRCAKLISEPLVLLSQVHTYTLSEAIQLLCEFVSASSAGMTLATTCLPSATLCDSMPISMGGVAVPGLVCMCTSDGGIGVWIEQGSHIKIFDNEMKANNRMAILYSKGIMHHHSVLVPAFVVKSKKPSTTLSSLAKSLFQQTENDGEVVKSLERVLSMARPPLASAQKGFLFTSDVLTTSSASFRGEDGGAAPSLTSSYPRGVRKGGGDTLFSCASVVGNQIQESDYGVYIQQYEGLQEDTHSSNPHTTVKLPVPSSFAQRRGSLANASSITPQSQNLNSSEVHNCVTTCDKEIMADIVFSSTARITFNARRVSLNVEKNTISRSKKCGVYSEHVVEISCSKSQEDYSALTNIFEKSYNHVLSCVLTKKPLPTPVSPLFRLSPASVEAAQVWVAHNALSGNVGPQVEVSSRYVVIFADSTRTLLQFDTVASHRHSNYVSRIFKEIEPYHTFLQHPPSEACVFDSNVFSDAKHGVRIAGYVGPLAARFQRNRFENLNIGLLVEGHLAACTVGEGNIFHNNHVGLKMDVAPSLRRPVRAENDKESIEMRNDLRTRMFCNIFKYSRDCSVLVSSTGDRSLLIYSNEFFGHFAGSMAVYLAGEKTHQGHEGTAIIKNAFLEGYTSLVVDGQGVPNGDGKIVPQEELRAVPTVVAENMFIGNYIGALVCKGATLRLLGNLFDSNFRCGLEVSGIGTKFQMWDCVFRNHYGSSMFKNQTPSPVSLKNFKDSRFLPNASLSLLMGTVLVELMQENDGLLNLETQRFLVAGMLADTFVEGVVERCTFADNEVGVDTIRDARSSSLVSLETTLKFIACAFWRNRVVGMLLRGSTAPSTNSYGDEQPAYTTNVKVGCGSWSDNRDVNEFREATTVQGCYFLENLCDKYTCGDVVSTNGSYGMFRDNLFHGTVHGMEGSHAVFVNNFFQDSNLNAQQDPRARYSSVILHPRSQLTFRNNFFIRLKKAILALSGASGMVQCNFMHKCGTGVIIAPHNCTIFRENKIFLSHKCGALIYGGFFTSNEVFGGATGLIIHSKNEYYKSIGSLPDQHNRGDIPLCSHNSICGCQENGVLVQGAATLEDNSVSNCENGFRMAPLVKLEEERVPLVKGNSIYSNGTGIYLEDDSTSNLQSNDIFDNKVCGVFVMDSASGTLHNNRISTIEDSNAIRMSNTSYFKQTGNTIRCQFSPGGAKVDVAANRSKELGKKTKIVQKECEGVEKELSTFMNKAQKMRDAAEKNINRMLDDLSSRIPSMSEESAKKVVSLRARTKGSLPRAVSHGERKRAESLTSIHEGHQQSAACGDKVLHSHDGDPLGEGPEERLVPNATIVELTEPMEPSSGPEVDHCVLIHVVSKPKTAPTGNSIGQSISRVLRTPGLAHIRFNITVTDGYGELTNFLKYSEPQGPFILIVVVDFRLHKLSLKYTKMLQSLFKVWGAFSEAEKPTHCLPPSSAPGMCCPFLYMVSPRSFLSGSGMSLRSKKNEGSESISTKYIEVLQEHAKRAHLVFHYRSHVYDVLPKIQKGVVQHMLHNHPAPSNGVSGLLTQRHDALESKEVSDSLPMPSIKLPAASSRGLLYKSPVKSSPLPQRQISVVLSKVKPEVSFVRKKSVNCDKKSVMGVPKAFSCNSDAALQPIASREVAPVYFTPDLHDLKLLSSNQNGPETSVEVHPSQLRITKTKSEEKVKNSRSPSFPRIKVNPLNSKRT